MAPKSTLPNTQQHGRWALLAGGGTLPTLVVRHAAEHGLPLTVIVFEGQPHPEGLEGLEEGLLGEKQNEGEQAAPNAALNTGFPTIRSFPLGAVGKILKALKSDGVTDVVMAGKLCKPELFSLKPDLRGAKLLASLAVKHDDALLRLVGKELEQEGMTVRGVHELMPDLLAPKGVWTKAKPRKEEEADAVLGFKVIQTLGALDIGQAAIVKEGVVLGVEAIEGTDALIERCANLRGKKSRGGVLVKAPKPTQDRRLDLPATGEKTVELLAKHGYAGLAVEANAVLTLNRVEMLHQANEAGLFLWGVEA